MCPTMWSNCQAKRRWIKSEVGFSILDLEKLKVNAHISYSSCLYVPVTTGQQ